MWILELTWYRGSRPPVWPLIYLFVYRFAIMPVITGATVFGVRRLLDGKIMSDPVLVSPSLARLSVSLRIYLQCKQSHVNIRAQG